MLKKLLELGEWMHNQGAFEQGTLTTSAFRADKQLIFMSETCVH